MLTYTWMTLVSCLVGITLGCTHEQTRFGCRIQEGECLCGVGCEIEYHYESRDDCLVALNGQAVDACKNKPCKNGGICTQKYERPGFTCHCPATGYYGPRCEKRCPVFNKALQNGLPLNFPTDCIVI